MMMKGTSVELIAAVTLDIKGVYPGIKVNVDNPCIGIVISTRWRKHQGKFIKMITFSPDQYPKSRFELNINKFKELTYE